MIDPARYVRKAVINALRLVNINAYQAPPSSAVPPYCLVSISYEQTPVKGIKNYRVRISIDICNEFREDGGTKKIDEIADNILDLMGIDSLTYLQIDNFEHVNCKLVSGDERFNRDNSITEFVKTLRFESIITENL